MEMTATAKKGYDMGSYEEGQKLFELGVLYASKYKCSEAIKYYTLSIQANENPAPYINRANLLGKRIRHFEALQDLWRAKQLDEEQSNEFSGAIDRELALTLVITQNYSSGARDKLINDYIENGIENAYTRIICTSFGISNSKWQNGALGGTFLEYHYFNELDNISKFDDIEKYPEAEDSLNLYPAEFIQHKLQSISIKNLDIYHQQERLLHSFLCSYGEEDMQYIRRNIIYSIDCKLMERDFGWSWNSLYSECEGITIEAAKFISSRRQNC